ncbi:MAG: hypothetical protein J5675_05655, partial [Bacteroidales bacterium]|nr:hypothetical protein [Bacteroidales bacterium]
LEVVGQGWILPADNTIHVITERYQFKFSTVKVVMDVTLVAITAILAFVFFSRLDGNGTTVVIREGTLIQAILTGLCMKLTDPLIHRLFPQKG